jgi:protease I
MATKSLQGVRVALLAADGYERIEVTRPLRALRKRGADVRVISLRPGRIRGVNFLWPGRKLSVDDTVFSADPNDYGALLLPGGLINPDLLRQSEHALAFVKEMDRSGKPIASICHGPQVLISAGLVSGRRMTSWPGVRTDVQNAGAHWEDREVVRDGNWVTSRGPHDLKAFDEAMCALFDQLASRDLPPLRRRVRWVATLKQAATLGGGLYAASRLLAPKLRGADLPGGLRARLEEELERRRRPTAGERLAVLGAAVAVPFVALSLSALASRLAERLQPAAGQGPARRATPEEEQARLPLE